MVVRRFPRGSGFALQISLPAEPSGSWSSSLLAWIAAQFDPVVYCLGPRPVSNAHSLADELEAAGVRIYFFARGDSRNSSPCWGASTGKSGPMRLHSANVSVSRQFPGNAGRAPGRRAARHHRHPRRRTAIPMAFGACPLDRPLGRAPRVRERFGAQILACLPD